MKEHRDNLWRGSGRLGDVTVEPEGGADVGETAFDRFVARESAALLRVAWGLTGDRAGAEDLVQATLERVWQRWGRLRDPNAAGGYARRVLLSIFLTWRRRRWWGERPTDDLDDAVVDDSSETIVVRHAVVTALRELPARQRAVVVLRYLDDRSEAATAAAMGCSVGTVKSQASRALAALRARPELRDHWPSSSQLTEETTHD